MIQFSETLVSRPPRLHRPQDALEKLKAYIAKFKNLGVKLQVRARPFGPLFDSFGFFF
jgi:hypothetical protein